MTIEESGNVENKVKLTREQECALEKLKNVGWTTESIVRTFKRRTS